MWRPPFGPRSSHTLVRQVFPPNTLFRLRKVQQAGEGLKEKASNLVPAGGVSLNEQQLNIIKIIAGLILFQIIVGSISAGFNQGGSYSV